MATPLARRAPPVTCAASCSQRARTLALEEGRSIDRHPPGASATRTDRERRTFVPWHAGGTHIGAYAPVGHVSTASRSTAIADREATTMGSCCHAS